MRKKYILKVAFVLVMFMAVVFISYVNAQDITLKKVPGYDFAIIFDRDGNILKVYRGTDEIPPQEKRAINGVVEIKTVSILYKNPPFCVVLGDVKYCW